MVVSRIKLANASRAPFPILVAIAGVWYSVVVQNRIWFTVASNRAINIATLATCLILLITLLYVVLPAGLVVELVIVELW